MGHLGNDCVLIQQEIGNMSSLSSSNAIDTDDGHSPPVAVPGSKVGRLGSNQERASTKSEGCEQDTDELQQTIERLFGLVNKKDRTLDEAESEDIIDDIQKLLKHLRKLSGQERSNADDKYRLSGRELRQDLKTIEGLVVVSHDIAVNKASESNEKSVLLLHYLGHDIAD